MAYLLVCDNEPVDFYNKAMEAKNVGYTKLEKNEINDFSVYSLTEICYANHNGKEEQELLWEEN